MVSRLTAAKSATVEQKKMKTSPAATVPAKLGGWGLCNIPTQGELKKNMPFCILRTESTSPFSIVKKICGMLKSGIYNIKN